MIPKKKKQFLKENPQKAKGEIVKTHPSEPVVHNIDASGQILGRLATRVANLLRGKLKPSFRPNLNMGDKVIIMNAAKISVTGNKMKEKRYYRHSGYLGHLKSQTMEEIYRKNPGELIRRAVLGMLPKNKLRKLWIKNLSINN